MAQSIYHQCYYSRLPAAAPNAKPQLDISIVIAAPPAVVLKAFFDAEALGAWWQVAHAVTTPRALGPYAIEWAPTDFRDDVLGRLGGVFRGTVVQFQPAQGFFVADAFWLPPDGDPIGPMALAVTCTPAGEGTRVQVRQTGFEESVRWRRYYEVIGNGWSRALASLKALLEK
jgi:uncharacterized protein YndB with AHSA1/START domain